MIDQKTAQFRPECRSRHQPCPGLLPAAAELPGGLARALLRGRGLVLDPASAASPGRAAGRPHIPRPGLPASRATRVN